VSTQENKPIQDMDQKELAEALPRLREEVVKAEEALRVAQESVAAATRQEAEVSTFVDVYEDHLVVDVRGRDKILGYLSRLWFPIDHVVRAEADPNIEWAVWRGWRVPGIRVPGVRFYDMHGRRDKTIVIWLKDETYDRLIVEVQDPAKVVARISDAVEASTRT
jgi:hypothetical protein